MKHTKTPWRVNHSTNGIESTDRAITLMTDLFGDMANSDEDKANAEHIVKCVNSHDALVAALELAVATRELNTGNGAQSQPAWKLDSNGNIDYEHVAKICRAALASCA